MSNISKLADLASGLGSGTPSLENLNVSGELALNGGSLTLNNAKAVAFKDASGVSRWCSYMSGSVSPSSGNDLFVGNPLAANTVLFTNNTERMRIDSSGNVGIGTSSPTSASGYKFLTIDDAGGTNGGVFESKSTGVIGRLYARSSTGEVLAGTFSNHPLTFQTNSIERARIDSSGNLLVGTTSGSFGQTGFILNPSYNAAGSAGIAIQHPNGSASGHAYAGFIYNGGGIGSITQNGTTSVSYNTSSDYRLKENIQPMQNALSVVQQLNPVTYTWKADGSEGQGFIAHELQAVVPDCVTGEKDAVDADGNPVYQGIDTSFLVATLVAAIQELKSDFDAYKATHP